MAKRYPNIIDAYQLARGNFNNCQVELKGAGGGIWVPARPPGASFNRLRATWLVWTGRADALVWRGQP